MEARELNLHLKAVSLRVRQDLRPNNRARWLFAAILIWAIATLAVPSHAAAQTPPPGFIYAEAIRGHIVVVNWEVSSATSGLITYKIYRGEGATEPSWPSGYAQVGSVFGQTQQSYVDTNPKKTSTRYWYLVTADSDIDTESQPSPTRAPYLGAAADPDTSDAKFYEEFYQPISTLSSYQYYIGPTTGAPVEPTNIEITGADTTITIDWDPVPSTNVAHYHVYRSDVSGEDGTLIAVVDAPQTVYVDTSAEKYRHYWYRVSAEDDQGEVGYPSIEKHFRTVAGYRPPAPHGGGGTPTPGADTCNLCHDPHAAEAPMLLRVSDGFGEPTLCLTCHDGTGSQYDIRREFTDPSLSSHQVTITAGDGSVVMGGAFTCVDCHTPHGDPEAVGSKKLLWVDGEKEGNAVCYGSGCHGSDSPGHWAGDLSAFEASDHNTEIPEPDSGTKVKCSTCHMPHASPNEALWVSSSYRSCLVCHSAENVSLTSPDIYTRITMNQDHDSHHDVLKRDQDANGTFIACQNCHNTHIVTHDNPLIDPENPSMSGQWSDGPATPLTVSGGSATAPRYNGFCLKCHDMSMPTAAMTDGWVAAPDDNSMLTEDIATLYANNNAHGALAAGGTPILNPASGYAYNDTLSCMVCHEPHGTINNYNLRCDVRAADGSILSEARLLVPRLDAAGVPTGAYDTRFFCMSCHQRQANNPPNHTSTNTNQPKTFAFFPTSCTDRACHMHGSATPRRF